MNQHQKIPQYVDLIKKIKRRTKIAMIIMAVAIISLFIFGLPSTATYSINGATETVTSEGLPTGILILLIALCFLVYFVALTFIMSPLASAMNQECDPEKQLILYLNISKNGPPNYIFLQDHFYLGNYSEAIKYADKMINDRKKNHKIVGLFQKARCAFFLKDIDMLKETTAKYDQELSCLNRQKEKQRLTNEKYQTVLHMLCALSDHDLEKIAALRNQIAPWSASKAAEAFVQYLKGLIAFELGETKEAEFRFCLVADQYPKLILASLSNEYLKKLSGEDDVIKEDSVISDERLDQTTEKTTEKICNTATEPIINPCDWTIPPISYQKPRGLHRAISIILFIATICSIWFALICVAMLSARNPGAIGNENMWVFFLFLPIPIASIVFGFYLKKKGVKYKKNVIVGFIMAAFLCIYGSFTFIFHDTYSHSDKPILNAEQILNIDIPTHKTINTEDWTRGTQSVPRGYIYSTSDIYFDDASTESFEKNLSDDTKWMSYIPNDMVGITSYFCDVQTYDYYIIYNKSTKEFNKLPKKSGTYVFINVLYNAENNTMKLVEYKIEYNK